MNQSPPRKYSPEGIAACILFILMIGAVLLQVSGRAGLAQPPIWTEELSRWLWVWAAFLGMAEVERTGGHLQMSFLADLMPAKFRTAVFAVIDLVYLGIIIHLIWIGYKGVIRTLHHSAVTMPTTDALLYASFPIAGIFLAYRIAIRLRGRVRNLACGPA